MHKRFFNEQEPEPIKKPGQTVIDRLKLDTSVNTYLLDVVKLSQAERDQKEQIVETYNRRISK